MQQQVAARSFDRKGLIKVGRAGRIECNERLVGAILVLVRTALDRSLGSRFNFGRKACWHLELTANSRQAIAQQSIGIAECFHRPPR